MLNGRLGSVMFRQSGTVFTAKMGEKGQKQEKKFTETPLVYSDNHEMQRRNF